MPVKVRCTSCDKILNAPDAARGKAIKCPACETRIAVPADDDSSGVLKSTARPSGKSTNAKGDSERKKKPAKPVDFEESLASFDLKKLEDKNARICFKCGYDMQYEDEDNSECPKCGYDSDTGSLGKKALKKQMKGPDPADFYPGLFKESWQFVLKNQALAWRTDVYIGVCLTISLVVAFLFLWISPIPPRAFFTLCFVVAFMVIPGWLWAFCNEVIKLTLERKDKFKRVLFDFFLCSATGLLSIAWFCVVGLPLMAIPLGIGYYLVKFNGADPVVFAICAGIGVIPVIWMFPIGIAHMTMPVTMPGWMVWKIVPAWAKTIKALTVWLLFLLVTTSPLIGGAAAIGAVWGNQIANIVETMESNASTWRARAAAEAAPKGKNAPVIGDVNKIGEIKEVDFKPLIGPGIILAVMVLPVGFIAMFNMRVIGQYIYYHKSYLGLIDKAKEYKYVAKERRGEDDEELKPRTFAKDAQEALLMGAVCALLGIVGGMLYGALSNAGILPGVTFGALIGGEICAAIGGFMVLGAAFNESVVWGLIYLFVPFGNLIYIIKYWAEARRGFLVSLFGGMIGITAFGILVVVMIMSGAGGAPGAVPAAPPPTSVTP